MRWTSERDDKLRALWGSTPAAEIAVQLQTSRGGVYMRAHKLSLPVAKRGRRPGLGGSSIPAGDPTGQRRFTGVESDGPRVDLKPWHPAIRLGTTIYGQMSVPAAQTERLLKSGKWNRKIGEIATKGRWKGLPIFTLTLEERSTCPRTCLEWHTCYGNNLGKQPRILPDDTLEPRLFAQLMHLMAVNNDGIIVRLHVLGDFFSVEYVLFWRKMLQYFPKLRIFGFTARLPDTEIGREVLYLIRDFEDQALFRVSGGGKPLLCSEVVDTEDQATGIVCPAEKDVDRCCATCGLCWQTDLTISFIKH